MKLTKLHTLLLSTYCSMMIGSACLSSGRGFMLAAMGGATWSQQAQIRVAENVAEKIMQSREGDWDFSEQRLPAAQATRSKIHIVNVAEQDRPLGALAERVRLKGIDS